MIDPKNWAEEAAKRLKEQFGSRLLYVGLQGSRQRGEATESSDIDLVTLLDEVSPADLAAHRAVTAALPDGDKTCGFTCGAKDFAHWPRHELFPFQMDTCDYYGKLSDFMPPVAREDIALGVKISASTLLHALTHTCLYGDPDNLPLFMAEACKAAFFMLRTKAWLESGQWLATKRELAEALSGGEREIILASRDFAAWSATRAPERALEILMAICRAGLRPLPSDASHPNP